MTCISCEDILYKMYTRRIFLSLIFTSIAIPILPIISKVNNKKFKPNIAYKNYWIISSDD